MLRSIMDIFFSHPPLRDFLEYFDAGNYAEATRELLQLCNDNADPAIIMQALCHTNNHATALPYALMSNKIGAESRHQLARIIIYCHDNGIAAEEILSALSCRNIFNANMLHPLMRHQPSEIIKYWLELLFSIGMENEAAFNTLFQMLETKASHPDREMQGLRPVDRLDNHPKKIQLYASFALRMVLQGLTRENCEIILNPATRQALWNIIPSLDNTQLIYLITCGFVREGDITHFFHLRERLLNAVLLEPNEFVRRSYLEKILDPSHVFHQIINQKPWFDLFGSQTRNMLNTAQESLRRLMANDPIEFVMINAEEPAPAPASIYDAPPAYNPQWQQTLFQQQNAPSAPTLSPATQRQNYPKQ